MATATAPSLESALHRPDWARRDYVAYRVKLIVDELRRFPALEELEELGRFRNPSIKGRSGFTDLADAIKAYEHDLGGIYQSMGGQGYLAAQEVDFPDRHQTEAVVMLGEKKRMLVYDQFRTGKTAIGIIAKPYLEANVINSMTAEQDGQWREISAMPLSEERQRLEERLYSEVVKEKAPTLIILPSSVKSSWRQKIEGYLSIPQTLVSIHSDAIVVERTRTGEQTILRGNRLADLKTALAQNPDYLIVSYDMVFRTTSDLKDPAVMAAVQAKYNEYAAQGIDRNSAWTKLAAAVGKHRADGIFGRSPELDDILRILAREEVKAEAQHVFEVLRDHGFRVLELDEVDNARNKRALRTKAVKELARTIEYFLPISGYPAPNKVIRDLDQLAAMIDPKNYDPESNPETAVPFSVTYANHPELVRNFILLHSKPQTKASDIGITPRDVIETDRVIQLEGAHREAYEAIRRYREMDTSMKLMLLRLAVIDPRLVHPAYYPGNKSVSDKLEEVFQDKPELLSRLEGEIGNPTSTVSSNYSELDRLVAEAVRRGDKFLVYTAKFKEGITDGLKQRYEARGMGMWKIDGDIEAGSDEYLSDREKIRLDFQTNPEKQGMVINQTVRAGISLDAANMLVTVDRDGEPGNDRQLAARLQGRYQMKPVKIYHITPANTVSRGIESMLADKELLIKLVFEGHELTPEQRRRIEERNFTRHPDIMQSINPQDYLNSCFRRMKGRGYHANLAFINADNGLVAQRYAESYEFDREYSYSAQTNRLLLRIIELLARSGQLSLDEILDAPSGNFALARVLLAESKLQFGRITNLDFNPWQLETGKAATAKLLARIDSEKNKRRQLVLESVLGPMHDLGFAENETFSLSVCSLGLHYASSKATIDEAVNGKARRVPFREREQIARELVRVTKNGGYVMFTLPPGQVDNQGMAKFTDAMRRLGVEPAYELNGIVKATKPEDSTYETYLWVGKRAGFRQEERLLEDAFALSTSASYTYPDRRNGNGTTVTVSPFSGEICTEFEFTRTQKPVNDTAVDYVRRIGYKRQIIGEEQLDQLRHRINAQTSQLGTALKTQMLETLDTIEASPDKISGQRNRMKQLAERARGKKFSATLQARLDELLASLEEL